ncbi:hypothetical protein C483_02935 [Natrialba hulunbeirensis JCM 10989]|uniref:DUF7344 domain-containing protein n=1 Tax=Natrialba hulunbeirensis JCM 10989 TaxID=1227493 RepID=M0A9S4_9EURY|nr:hypothetical protein [Natrialba hulunbeirensis]ELY94652.1 hypothetical protein C483_02935 [Natrialba hulunbeirensis JCM 10989]
MDNTDADRSETLDELLTLCAHRHCRGVLTYFRRTSETTVSLATLVDSLLASSPHQETAAPPALDRSHLALHLHHSTLPRLSEAGVLEYDSRSNTVRYHGHRELERLMAAISER